MTMPYSAAIFDLDGLLIDSEPTWHNVHPQFLQRHGISIDQGTLKQTLGRGIKDVIQFHKDENGLTGDTDELAAEFRGMFYDEFLSEKGLKLMPGAIAFVTLVFDNGYKLGLATGGHAKENVIKMLERLSLLKYFEVIVSSDMVKKGKPDPEVFLFTAKQLQVEPSQCLVFEDSPNGVLAGKRAGMTVFGVNPSEEIRKELHTAGADVIYTSLDEVDLRVTAKS
jgi:HAD superfamily hydrolase (TIGR01509 family)